MGLPGLSEKDADKVRVGNALTRTTVMLCRLCAEFGVAWALENPRTSRLWLCPALRRLRATRWRGAGLRPEAVHLDFCQCGESWKKGTTFLYHGIDFSGLLRRCRMKGGRCSRTGKKHLVLSGTDSSGQFLTRKAQPYPLELCKEIAAIVRCHVASKNSKAMPGASVWDSPMRLATEAVHMVDEGARSSFPAMLIAARPPRSRAPSQPRSEDS